MIYDLFFLELFELNNIKSESSSICTKGKFQAWNLKASGLNISFDFEIYVKEA